MRSTIGSSGRPIPRIWKKWSMTQIESNPASSAARTTRASVGPSCCGPPGQLNELIWSPNFTRGSSTEEAAGVAETPRHIHAATVADGRPDPGGRRIRIHGQQRDDLAAAGAYVAGIHA